MSYSYGKSAHPYRIVDQIVDPTPMPASVPHVDEVGATSAPLISASYFIGHYCLLFNDSFMKCKQTQSNPQMCLKQGRKVTRCAIDLLTKLKENCASEHEEHFSCLNYNNYLLFKCRAQEKVLNKCVKDKLGLIKHIPGGVKNDQGLQIHLQEPNDVYYK